MNSLEYPLGPLFPFLLSREEGSLLHTLPLSDILDVTLLAIIWSRWSTSILIIKYLTRRAEANPRVCRGASSNAGSFTDTRSAVHPRLQGQSCQRDIILGAERPRKVRKNTCGTRGRPRNPLPMDLSHSTARDREGLRP